MVTAIAKICTTFQNYEESNHKVQVLTIPTMYHLSFYRSGVIKLLK